MKCGDAAYERQLDQKIDLMIESLPNVQDKEDEIVLTFFHQNLGSGLNKGFFGQISQREAWEQWIIPFQQKDTIKKEEEVQLIEEIMLDVVMDITDKINNSNDVMPPLYEQLKCFPFEIELKKSQAGKSSWLIGGLFKKFTS